MFNGYKTYILVLIGIIVQILFRFDFIYKMNRDDILIAITLLLVATIAHKLDKLLASNLIDIDPK